MRLDDAESVLGKGEPRTSKSRRYFAYGDEIILVLFLDQAPSGSAAIVDAVIYTECVITVLPKHGS